jgi:penicillin amidase
MFNTLLHGLKYPESLTNSYDWFTNLNDTSAPQDADSIIVEALDKVLADWDTYDFSPGYTITYDHSTFLGEVWKSPLLNRGTYDHIVEMGPDGPVWIER